MDDESKQLLRQLVDAQKEQTDLLRRHVLPLWTRIRFSLLALFVLMTLMATGIGFSVLAIRSTNTSNSTRQPAILNPPNAGTFQFWPTPRVEVSTTKPIDGTVQIWPTPSVDVRTYDGRMGKEIPR